MESGLHDLEKKYCSYCLSSCKSFIRHDSIHAMSLSLLTQSRKNGGICMLRLLMCKICTAEVKIFICEKYE